MSMKLLRRIFSPEFLVKPDQRLGAFPRGRDAYKETMKIALPSIIEMVLISLIGSLDTMMVGNVLGAEALSSVGLPNQPRMIFYALFFALNIGVTAIVARRKGEERQENANTTLRNALMLSFGLSLVMTAIAVIFAEPVMKLAGGDHAENEKVFRDAVEYFRIMLYAMPINVIAMCICAAQRGIGRTKITMWVNVASNITNVFFNYCLIGGNLGFPRLEVRGAAIASVIGMFVGMVMALATVLIGGKHKGYLHLSIHDRWHFDRESMRSIIKVGGNASVEQIGMRIGFFIFGRILFSMGTIQYAAHQICAQLLNITFTFGDGLAVASTTLIGQNMGRKRPDLSMMYGKVCQRYAMVGSFLLGVLIILLRHGIAGLFIGENTANADEVLSFAAQALIVLAFVQAFQTTSVVFSGSLRGAGDNLYVAAVATMTISVMRPIMGVIAVYVLKLDLAGTWILAFSDVVLRTGLLWHRFNSGKWKHIKV